MTVRELIEKLSAFDPDWPVVSTNLESGYDTVSTVKEGVVVWTGHVDHYDEDHELYAGRRLSAVIFSNEP